MLHGTVGGCGRVETAIMNTFLGVDLGWYGKPTGLASVALEDGTLQLRKIARLEAVEDILSWIESEAGAGSAVRGRRSPGHRESNRNPARGTGSEPRFPPVSRRLPRCQSGPAVCRPRDLVQPPPGRTGIPSLPRNSAAPGRTFPDRNPPARGGREPVRTRSHCEVQAWFPRGQGSRTAAAAKTDALAFAGFGPSTLCAAAGRAAERQHKTSGGPD